MTETCVSRPGALVFDTPAFTPQNVCSYQSNKQRQKGLREYWTLREILLKYNEKTFVFSDGKNILSLEAVGGRGNTSASADHYCKGTNRRAAASLVRNIPQILEKKKISPSRDDSSYFWWR